MSDNVIRYFKRWYDEVSCFRGHMDDFCVSY